MFVLGLLDQFYYRVVHVYFEHVPYLLLEDFIHHPLISGARIPQPERHDIVHVIGVFGHESRVFPIIFAHGDLIVAGVSVHEGQQLVAGGILHQFVNIG